jgi:hypothetical protein
MKKALLLAALLAVVWYFKRLPAEHSAGQPAGYVSESDAIAEAYANQASGVQVTGAGTVSRVLADDEEGGRHQRFILRLASGRRCWSRTTSTSRRGSIRSASGTASSSTASTNGTTAAA